GEEHCENELPMPCAFACRDEQCNECERERTWPWEFVLAVLFTAMFYVRYVGPFYVAPLALVAALVQVRRSGWYLALLRAGTALSVSMVLPWLWLMRNKDISG
ncbi:MAG: hypothetical protein ACKO97_03330, partial [Actinomycetota bacterium]